MKGADQCWIHNLFVVFDPALRHRGFDSALCSDVSPKSATQVPAVIAGALLVGRDAVHQRQPIDEVLAQLELCRVGEVGGDEERNLFAPTPAVQALPLGTLAFLRRWWGSDYNRLLLRTPLALLLAARAMMIALLAYATGQKAY